MAKLTVNVVDVGLEARATGKESAGPASRVGLLGPLRADPGVFGKIYDLREMDIFFHIKLTGPRRQASYCFFFGFQTSWRAPVLSTKKNRSAKILAFTAV